MTGAVRHRGALRVVGVGPGDPELLTLKAARILGSADVVAFFAKAGRPGHARTIVEGALNPAAEQLRLVYPFTTEVALDDPRYLAEMAQFYESAASTLADRLDRGLEVALLSEGDPFFYGSSMYLFDRLARDYAHEVIPGVTGMSGCWAQARIPICHGDDVFCVLPGTLDEDTMIERLKAVDAAVIMKVGRNLEKIRRALRAAGLLNRAMFVERGTMGDERIVPLARLEEDKASYFSLVLVPGRQRPR
ncbi:precorrin-2 C(20)-methyltransferase [Bradyrhizobium sp. WD16]|uniref:precorrin-2 C(20)-methyltransferase n=1 Tax=Bradyrhizobium sp. WD16 TaxID=1521768 RepID=UPI0020A319E7|nr:precorrin-2 C(20)-methyltransferase [Bradyrhizobium sp. WD16]UTD27563.1 precorrin-2 C(20)-methyltransferase [Bradyrhizobium sp. WD16]